MLANTAIWGGLHGLAAGSSIIQDGVVFEHVSFISVTKAWIEYFPLSPQFLTNFTTAKGDNVTFWAWEGDANCAFGFPGGLGSGCFQYQNNTRGTNTGTLRVAAPNNNFAGATCEGIIERVGNNLLSKWDGIPTMAFDCLDFFGGAHNATSDPFLRIRMVNSTGSRALASKGNPNLAGFDWITEL